MREQTYLKYFEKAILFPFSKVMSGNCYSYLTLYTLKPVWGLLKTTQTFNLTLAAFDQKNQNWWKLTVLEALCDTWTTFIPGKCSKFFFSQTLAQRMLFNMFSRFLKELDDVVSLRLAIKYQENHQA